MYEMISCLPFFILVAISIKIIGLPGDLITAVFLVPNTVYFISVPLVLWLTAFCYLSYKPSNITFCRKGCDARLSTNLSFPLSLVVIVNTVTGATVSRLSAEQWVSRVVVDRINIAASVITNKVVDLGRNIVFVAKRYVNKQNLYFIIILVFVFVISTLAGIYLQDIILHIQFRAIVFVLLLLNTIKIIINYLNIT
jgi:hypothetical protein